MNQTEFRKWCSGMCVLVCDCASYLQLVGVVELLDLDNNLAETGQIGGQVLLNQALVGSQLGVKVSTVRASFHSHLWVEGEVWVSVCVCMSDGHHGIRARVK